MPVTFVNATTNSSIAASGDLVVTKPSGVLDGHVIVASLQFDSATTISATPTGFTQINTFTNSFLIARAYSKVCMAEGTTYTWSFTGNSRPILAAITFWAGANLAAPINNHAHSQATTTNPVTTPTVATTAVCKMLHLANIRDTAGAGNTNSPASGTERVDFVVSSGDSYNMSLTESNAMVSAGSITGVALTNSSAPTLEHQWQIAVAQSAAPPFVLVEQQAIVRASRW